MPRRFQVHYGGKLDPRNSYVVVDTAETTYRKVLLTTLTKSEAVNLADKLNKEVK